MSTDRKPIVLHMRSPADATRYVLDHMSDLSPPAAVVALTAMVEEMSAELEVARPVVEAADAWQAYMGDDMAFPAEVTLAAAVDLYRSATTRNLDSDVPDPSLTAETLPTTPSEPEASTAELIAASSLGAALDALSVSVEPVPSTPRVWAMPEIPEDVSAVRDRDGGRWTRATFDGQKFWRQIGPVKIDNTGAEETHLWTGTLALLRDYGPLTEVEETNDGRE